MDEIRTQYFESNQNKTCVKDLLHTYYTCIQISLNTMLNSTLPTSSVKETEEEREREREKG